MFSVFLCYSLLVNNFSITADQPADQPVADVHYLIPACATPSTPALSVHRLLRLPTYHISIRQMGDPPLPSCKIWRLLFAFLCTEFCDNLTQHLDDGLEIEGVCLDCHRTYSN